MKSQKIAFAMKKKAKGTADARHEFRCSKEELEKFREAAYRDGFNGNVSAWIMWNLRKIIAAKDDEKK